MFLKGKRVIASILMIVLMITAIHLDGFAQNSDSIVPQNGNQVIDSGAYVTGNIKTINNLLEQSQFTSRQGHGFAAERGNNLIDRLHGRNATVIGGDNVKNGADRKILNRDGSVTLIQDKYHASAKEGIDACFEDGKFRYLDGDGNPMQIEVPSDQYNDAIKCMEDKIRNGEVPGITDPAEAKNLVRKGSLTYKQAVNLAKAGTVESLTYDALKGTVSAACGFGISTLINYAVARRNGSSREEAIKVASINGFKTGGVIFATSVISSQLARTGVVTIFAPSAEALTNALGPEFAKALLNSVGKVTTDMTTEGILKNAAKVLRNQGLTASITIIVLTSVDVIDLFRGRISAEQMIKNLAVTSAAVVGGYAGSTIGGIAGTAVAPGVGTIVGNVVGAMVIGGAAGVATEQIMGVFLKDDAEKMLEVLEIEFQRLAEDYILSDEEADRVVYLLKDELTSKNLKDMYASQDKEAFADSLIEPLMEDEIKKREEMKAPSEEEIRAELKATLQGVVFIH